MSFRIPPNSFLVNAARLAGLVAVCAVTLGAGSAESTTSPKFMARTNSLAPVAQAPAPITPVVQEEVVVEPAPAPASAAAPVTEAPVQAPPVVSNVRTIKTVQKQGALYAVGADGILRKIAACESGGNYRAVNPSGKYRGAYQFDYRTWAGVGGSGDPAAASPAEQDLRAKMLYDRRGAQPWPVCGRR